MKVSKKFIEEYVSSFSGYGGQISKEDLVSGDFTISDTTLTKSNIDSIKSYNIHKYILFSYQNYFIKISKHLIRLFINIEERPLFILIFFE